MFIRITLLAIGFTPACAFACVIAPPVVSTLLFLVATLAWVVFFIESAFRSTKVRKVRWKAATPYFVAYGLLFVFVVVAIVMQPRCPGPARVPKAKSEIRNITVALQMYKLDNHVYPGTEQGLLALVRRPNGLPIAVNWNKEGYLPYTPVDPWGREYLYKYSDLNDEKEVYSLGRDGKYGGTGEDADLFSFQL